MTESRMCIGGNFDQECLALTSSIVHNFVSDRLVLWMIGAGLRLQERRSRRC